MKMDMKSIDVNINTIVKNPLFDISPKLQRAYRAQPNEKNTIQILSALKKQRTNNHDELDAIKSIMQINAINPLVQLGQQVKLTDDVILTSFESHETNVTAIFTAPDARELVSLEKQLIGLSLPSASIIIDAELKTLQLSFKNL